MSENFKDKLLKLIRESEDPLVNKLSALSSGLWFIFAVNEVSDDEIERFFMLVSQKPQSFDRIRERIGEFK